MAAPKLHADQVGLSQVIGQNLKLAGQLGMLTDQNVIDSATYADLKNFIDTNAKGLHADQQGYVDRLKRAIDMGFTDGSFTDANVAAATGVTNLATMTQADTSRIGGPILE